MLSPTENRSGRKSGQPLVFNNQVTDDFCALPLNRPHKIKTTKNRVQEVHSKDLLWMKHKSTMVSPFLLDHDKIEYAWGGNIYMARWSHFSSWVMKKWKMYNICGWYRIYKIVILRGGVLTAYDARVLAHYCSSQLSNHYWPPYDVWCLGSATASIAAYGRVGRFEAAMNLLDAFLDMDEMDHSVSWWAWSSYRRYRTVSTERMSVETKRRYDQHLHAAGLFLVIIHKVDKLEGRKSIFEDKLSWF